MCAGGCRLSGADFGNSYVRCGSTAAGQELTFANDRYRAGNLILQQVVGLHARHLRRRLLADTHLVRPNDSFHELRSLRTGDEQLQVTPTDNSLCQGCSND